MTDQYLDYAISAKGPSLVRQYRMWRKWIEEISTNFFKRRKPAYLENQDSKYKLLTKSNNDL